MLGLFEVFCIGIYTYHNTNNVRDTIFMKYSCNVQCVHCGKWMSRPTCQITIYQAFVYSVCSGHVCDGPLVASVDESYVDFSEFWIPLVQFVSFLAGYYLTISVKGATYA
jgi:hypothetical protein